MWPESTLYLAPIFGARDSTAYTGSVAYAEEPVPKSTFTPQYAWLREALVEARANAGLTQRDVAARIGRPPSYVANCETGERRIDVIEFFEIARAVDADPVALLRRLAAHWNDLDERPPDAKRR